MEPVDWKRGPDARQPVVDQIEPEDGIVYHGILDSSQLDSVAQWIIKNIEAALGESRDWDAVRSWAEGMAYELKEPG